MKFFTTIALLLLISNGIAQTATITPGQPAPEIKLLSVNNKLVSFQDYPSAKGFIIVFMSNTCPFSKAYEKRVIQLHNKYASLGFPVIAINPNDPIGSPGDNFANMKKRAKSAQYTFPYLYDEEQKITASYGAKHTPHVFLVKQSREGSTVEYTGAIDNDTQNSDPNKIKYVEEAITALLDNKKPASSMSRAIGCAVIWKKI